MSEQRRPLKDAIAEQAGKARLDHAQLQALLAMQQPERRLHPDRRRAALGLLVLAVLLVLGSWQWHSRKAPDPRLAIATEVANNHLKLKPLDVTARSMAEIQQFFTLLDFAPINSAVLQRRFAINEQQLLGGRYCSIQGITAAQLRYRLGDQPLHTLYAVGYDADKHGDIANTDLGQAPEHIPTHGLTVHLWREKNLLFALVSEDTVNSTVNQPQRFHDKPGGQ